MQKAEFENKRSLLRSGLTEKSVGIVEMVLVDQVPQHLVAAQFGMTRQNVSAMVKRANALMQGLPVDWVKLEEWMPKPMAVEIRQRLARLRAEHAAQQRQKGNG